MASQELSRVISFFKALSDESRLKIVGALANSDHSVDELAVLLDLKAPTVSHHLSRLKELALVTMEQRGNSHVYKLNMSEIRSMSKRLLTLDTINAIGDEVATDAWERKILRDF